MIAEANVLSRARVSNAISKTDIANYFKNHVEDITFKKEVKSGQDGDKKDCDIKENEEESKESIDEDKDKEDEPDMITYRTRLRLDE